MRRHHVQAIADARNQRRLGQKASASIQRPNGQLAQYVHTARGRIGDA